MSAGPASAAGPPLGASSDDQLPLLLNAAEAAALLGIGRSTFLRYDLTGIVPRGAKLGRVRRWPREELVAWTRAGCPPRVKWEEARRR